jgi:hypothetical protein
MQVLNVKVLESLSEDLMKPKNLNYNDLLKISPYEFTWYNTWFQKIKLVKEFAVEPFFKTFHMRQEYSFSRAKLLRREDFAQAYVGLVLNSKWTPPPPLKYENPDSIFYKIIYKLITGDNVLSRFYFRYATRDIFFRVFKKIKRCFVNS